MKNFNMRPVLGRGNTPGVACGLSVRSHQTFNPGVSNDRAMNMFNMQGLHNTLPVTENLRCKEEYMGRGNENELVSGIKAILSKQLPDNGSVDFTHKGGISNAQFQVKQMMSSMPLVSDCDHLSVYPVFPTGPQYNCSLSSVPVSSHSMDHSIGHFSPVTMGENWMENEKRRVHKGRKTQNNVIMNTVNDNTQWLYCKLCDCSVNSDYQMKIHKDGKKHQKKVEMTQRLTVGSRAPFTPNTSFLPERLSPTKLSSTIDTWNDYQNVNSWGKYNPTSHVSQLNMWCNQPNSPTHSVKGDTYRRDDSDYFSANSDTDSTVSL